MEGLIGGVNNYITSSGLGIPLKLQPKVSPFLRACTPISLIALTHSRAMDLNPSGFSSSSSDDDNNVVASLPVVQPQVRPTPYYPSP